MCQAWEWKRHSVVTMARRLRRAGSRASAGTTKGAAMTPRAMCLRNSRRAFIWAGQDRRRAGLHSQEFHSSFGASGFETILSTGPNALKAVVANQIGRAHV